MRWRKKQKRNHPDPTISHSFSGACHSQDHCTESLHHKEMPNLAEGCWRGAPFFRAATYKTLVVPQCLTLRSWQCQGPYSFNGAVRTIPIWSNWFNFNFVLVSFIWGQAQFQLIMLSFVTHLHKDFWAALLRQQFCRCDNGSRRRCETQPLSNQTRGGTLHGDQWAILKITETTIHQKNDITKKNMIYKIYINILNCMQKHVINTCVSFLRATDHDWLNFGSHLNDLSELWPWRWKGYHMDPKKYRYIFNIT